MMGRQDRQVQAVLREYREALEDGNYMVAARIMKSNPDLRDELWEAFSNVPGRPVS